MFGLVREWKSITKKKLTYTHMSVDGSVTSSSSQAFPVSVRDMSHSTWVSILFSQSEIDRIDLVSSLSKAHEKVVWLDIAV